ncbi:MAG: RHS repeat-associated core domain-containing protein [Xanthomonadales bacterium]|nr:RHS repeat-associated core domain-containing protein [Xanthomonadales bacterium]
MGGVIIKVARQSGVLVKRREFLFQDAQGSTYAVTDASGQPLGPATGQGNRMSFDPFGQRRQASGAPLSLPEQWAFDSSQTTRQGYTGHEQVDALGLIHMNGRLYDPVLGRFIQADPFVQDPANSQSFNRYTYVFNNPLAWTDPSGYLGKREKRWARGIAAIVITVYTGNYAAGLKGWAAAGATAAGGAAAGAVATGSLRGAVQGSLSALVFWGVGQGADTWLGVGKDSVDSFNLGRSFLHGAAGGTLASLQGGKFGHGFVQAGMGKALSANIHAGSDTGDFFVATIIGGTLSEATGGKFVNGAVTGAMQYAFNQLQGNRRQANRLS